MSASVLVLMASFLHVMMWIPGIELHTCTNAKARPTFLTFVAPASARAMSVQGPVVARENRDGMAHILIRRATAEPPTFASVLVRGGLNNLWVALDMG